MATCLDGPEFGSVDGPQELPPFEEISGTITGGKLELKGSGLRRSLDHSFTHWFFGHRLRVVRKGQSFLVRLDEWKPRSRKPGWHLRAKRRFREGQAFTLNRLGFEWTTVGHKLEQRPAHSNGRSRRDPALRDRRYVLRTAAHRHARRESRQQLLVNDG